MTRPSILILADPKDSHALVVGRRLETNHHFAVSISDFPTLATTQHRTYIDRDGMVECWSGVNLDQVAAAWWRRPIGQKPLTDGEEDAQFVRREWMSYLYGSLLLSGVPIINDPAKEKDAQYKATQLVAASSLGLRIPSTLASNDPAAIIDFWTTHNRDCIYKPFRQPPARFLDTRRLLPEDFVDWSAIYGAPIIVQERIAKRRDVRVNVFGSEVFAAHLDSLDEDNPLDWRTMTSRLWKVHDLPLETSSRLVQLVAEMGLQYGCIDLVQDVNGEYVFLEINPSGQFLFIEIDTGQPLTAALADLLVSCR